MIMGTVRGDCESMFARGVIMRIVQELRDMARDGRWAARLSLLPCQMFVPASSRC